MATSCASEDGPLKEHLCPLQLRIHRLGLELLRRRFHGQLFAFSVFNSLLT